MNYCPLGHIMTITGGANCGCHPDAACSVPVYACRQCGHTDYGNNTHAKIVKDICAEHRDCRAKAPPMEGLHLTRDEFWALPEYSVSNPTGVVPGKRWRRHDGIHDPACKEPTWIIGEYVDEPQNNRCVIVWSIPAVVPDDVMAKLREAK